MFFDQENIVFAALARRPSLAPYHIDLQTLGSGPALAAVNRRDTLAISGALPRQGQQYQPYFAFTNSVARPQVAPMELAPFAVSPSVYDSHDPDGSAAYNEMDSLYQEFFTANQLLELPIEAAPPTWNNRAPWTQPAPGTPHPLESAAPYNPTPVFIPSSSTCSQVAQSSESASTGWPEDLKIRMYDHVTGSFKPARPKLHARARSVELPAPTVPQQTNPFGEYSLDIPPYPPKIHSEVDTPPSIDPLELPFSLPISIPTAPLIGRLDTSTPTLTSAPSPSESLCDEDDYTSPGASTPGSTTMLRSKRAMPFISSYSRLSHPDRGHSRTISLAQSVGSARGLDEEISLPALQEAQSKATLDLVRKRKRSLGIVDFGEVREEDVEVSDPGCSDTGMECSDSDSDDGAFIPTAHSDVDDEDDDFLPSDAHSVAINNSGNPSKKAGRNAVTNSTRPTKRPRLASSIPTFSVSLGYGKPRPTDVSYDYLPPGMVSCPVCNHTPSGGRASDLRRHMERHKTIGKKKWACTKCSEVTETPGGTIIIGRDGFVRCDSLKRHWSREHGNEEWDQTTCAVVYLESASA